MCIFLEAIDAGNINGILVEVLQEISDHEQRQNSKIHLSHNFLSFEGIDFHPLHALVKLIIIIETISRSNWRNLNAFIVSCWRHGEGGYPASGLDKKRD
jgi:hypothetical protein